jgi:hypothetical protein
MMGETTKLERKSRRKWLLLKSPILLMVGLNRMDRGLEETKKSRIRLMVGVRL